MYSVPVSYTHLDVYKRQEERCCPNQFSTLCLSLMNLSLSLVSFGLISSPGRIESKFFSGSLEDMRHLRLSRNARTELQVGAPAMWPVQKGILFLLDHYNGMLVLGRTNKNICQDRFHESAGRVGYLPWPTMKGLFWVFGARTKHLRTRRRTVSSLSLIHI